MNTIENSLVAARQADIDRGMPGSMALADAEAEQARVRRAESDAEADKQWRAANAPEPNYNYRAAHTTGVDLTRGELPNEFYEPGTQNVAGFDMPTGKKYKSVVFKDYEGNAFYGVNQLSRSKKRIGGERPPEDTIGMTAVAAAMQASGATYEDFANAFPDWSDNHKTPAWRAGTDALRQKELVDKYGPTFLVGLYQPQPTSLDFDVRMADKQFQQDARKIYRHYVGMDFNDTDVAAARWLAGHLRDIDFNPWTWPMIMLKAKNAGADVHKAYGSAIEAWDLTNMEKAWLPQLGNLGRVLVDPFNYVGLGIGKLTVVTAGRAAAKDFFKRLAVGAALGAPEGAAQATVRAGTQGRDPTGGELAAGAASQAAGAGFGNAGVPELVSAGVKAGKAVARGIKAFSRPDMPAILPENVVPKGSSIYGEITLPSREGDQPVRTTPDAPAQEVAPKVIAREETELPAAPREEPALEQVPYEQGPAVAAPGQLTEGQADEILGGPSAGYFEARNAQAALETQAGEQAAAALPVARPAPPQDPGSRVFVDPATGYYSTSQQAVAEFNKNEAPASEWLAVMNKAPNRRLDEIAWLDMEKLFKKYKGKPIPKEAVLDHIDKNLIKTQRYPLVPQRRNTIPFHDYLLNNSDDYARLDTELERLRKITNDIYAAYINKVGTTFSSPTEVSEARTAWQTARDAEKAHEQHVARVRAEQHKAWVASGQPPPGVHTLETMLTDFDSGVAQETREQLNWIYQLIDKEAINQAKKAAARAPGRIAAIDAEIANNQRHIQQAWARFEEFAAESGAFVKLDDLAHVEGFLRFGDPEVRYASLLGVNESGAQVTANGVDPLGHQIAMYRHPEGLRIGGSDFHPGGTAPGVTGWAITSERAFENGETIRFVDEGQNDFVKMRRKAEHMFGDYKKSFKPGDPSKEAALAAEANSYDEWVWLRYRDEKIFLSPKKGGGDATAAEQARTAAKFPERWEDVTPAQRMAMMKDPLWNDQIRWETDFDPAMVALPKQLFFSTALSNIFKSELYNAALEGKQWFGWTTTETFWGRSPHEAPRTVSGTILAAPNSIYNTIVLQQGANGPKQGFTFDEAMAMGDKIGGEQGAALRKYVDKVKEYGRMRHELFAPPHPGQMQLDLEKPLVFKEGKENHYNVQTKKGMEDYLKTLGIPDAKIVKKEMPIAPGSPHKATGWFIEITPALRAKLAQGVPLGAAASVAVLAPQEEEAMQ